MSAALNDMLRELAREQGTALADLTVLSATVDPFRLDTPGNREAAAWLAEQMDAPEIRGRRLHNRGLHYAIAARSNVRLPSGKTFVNDADCWAYVERGSKAARWLGYVPFDDIDDARNSAPVIRSGIGDNVPFQASIEEPDTFLYLRELASFRPAVEVYGWRSQPYRLVIFGEKTSLD